jgi:DNA-binding NarL/FixJ family response regulator
VSAGAHVVIADGRAATRAGLRVALAKAGFEVVAEAQEREAFVETALAARPDLALVAADLPGGGIAAVRTIAERLPRAKLVVISARPSGEELVTAVLAGASGYLPAGMSLARLPDALRGVLAGEVALPRAHSGHLLEALRFRDAGRASIAGRSTAKLTEREWDVIQLLGENASTAVMAQRLGISEVTVRRHVSSLLAKLEVPDRAAAAELFRRRSTD